MAGWYGAHLLILAIGVLLTLSGLVAIAAGPAIASSGVWVVPIGLAPIVGAVIERARYRSDEAERTAAPQAGGGEPTDQPIDPRFRPTDERSEETRRADGCAWTRSDRRTAVRSQRYQRRASRSSAGAARRAVPEQGGGEHESEHWMCVSERASRQRGPGAYRRAAGSFIGRAILAGQSQRALTTSRAPDHPEPFEMAADQPDRHLRPSRRARARRLDRRVRVPLPQP